jgi:putative endopeptidase
VDLTNTYLGDLVSKYFVQVAFGGDSLQTATQMADFIIASFMANLQSLDWMDEGTQKYAEVKETMLARLIGYPGSFSNYTYVGTQGGGHYWSVCGGWRRTLMMRGLRWCGWSW